MKNPASGWTCDGSSAISSRDCWIACASMAAGAAAGLAFMYLFDPDRGERRRRRLLAEGKHRIEQAKLEVTGKVEDLVRDASASVREVISNTGLTAH